MNTRDPFRLHRSPSGSPFASVQSSFARSAVPPTPESDHVDDHLDSSPSAPSAATTTTTTAANMSYPIARHVHSSSNDQTQQDSNWQPRRPQHDRHASAFEEKFNELFQGGEKSVLPMYKDKPYSYGPSRRRQPLWRRRLWLAITGVVCLALYWTGFFSGTDRVKEHVDRLRSSGFSSTWDARRNRVRDAFKVSWKAYEKYAWGFDEYHPISKKGRMMVPNGMGWIIVDALDTMMIMNLTTEIASARQWIHTALSYDKDHDVNTFETTIRMLGGLLSAHYLESIETYHDPDDEATGGEDLFIEKAADLGDRLLGAFKSPTGIPYASINLKTREGIPSHDDHGASSTAEAGTVQLELKYLAHETGEKGYWDAAEKAINAIDDNGARDGLVPIFISADHGRFSGNNIRLGSRGDSYYEYLIKQYLQTHEEEHIYSEMWDQAFEGVKKHLIAYSEHSNLTVLGERPQGLDGELSGKMDHLACFLPGTIALALTGGDTVAEHTKAHEWSAKQEADMQLAKELMKTCWGMYAASPTGLAAEISHLRLGDSPAMMSDGVRKGPATLGNEAGSTWRKDYDIHPGDFHNLQRPETIESLFYMWRITQDPIYREWGWKIFEAFEKHTLVSQDAGYSSIGSIMTVPAPFRDNMESFWLSETLKYLYLLFSPSDLLPLDEVVFNTEGHPFPRFGLNKILKTGWSRKPRDKDGVIIREKHAQASTSTTSAHSAPTQGKDTRAVPAAAASPNPASPAEQANQDPIGLSAMNAAAEQLKANPLHLKGFKNPDADQAQHVGAQ